MYLIPIYVGLWVILVVAVMSVGLLWTMIGAVVALFAVLWWLDNAQCQKGRQEHLCRYLQAIGLGTNNKRKRP